MFLVPYLVFPRTKDALELYKKAFDIEVVEFHAMQKEMGKQWNLPENFDYENSCTHASFKVYGNMIFANDQFGPDKLVVGNAIYLALNFTAKDDGKEAQTAYDKSLKAGFEVVIPYKKELWGYFGATKDKFGIVWSFNQSL